MAGSPGRREKGAVIAVEEGIKRKVGSMNAEVRMRRSSQMKMKNMKAAVVGAGLMGNVHADSLASVEGISLKWVVDKHECRGKALAEKYGATWTKDVNPLLKDSETQIVIHALPTYHRLEYLGKYMDAGKHILCEKPLARNLEEAQTILNTAKGYDKVFMTGHVVRYFWEYAQAHDLIISGEIGTPGIARLSRCGGRPSSQNKTDNWYLDFQRSGGVLLDLAIHDLDWLLWTFGPVRRCFAQMTDPKDNHSDYSLAIIKFKTGVLAHVETSWTEAPGSFWSTFEVSGSDGIMEYDMRDTKTLALTHKTSSQDAKAGTVIPESPTFESPYMTEMKHFVECIQKGKKPLTGVKEAFEAARLALNLIESAQTGMPVE
jgi:predicted dehydrogenase